MNQVIAFTLLFGLSAHAATEVAKVNGKSITKEEVQAVLSTLPAAQKDSIIKDLSAKKQLVSGLIDQSLLIQEAEKEKLDKDKEFQTAVEQFRKSFIVDRLLSKNLGSKMSEQSARSYYQANKSKYNTDQIHVMHILTGDELQAKEVLKLAQAPNADFQALAEKYSKDPSAKNNRGDLGLVGRGQFVEEFESAAFRTSPGQIVGPIKTQFGFHIIKVMDRQSGRALSYDEAELKVKQDMRTQLTKDYLGRLKKSAKITIDEKELQKL